MKPLRRPFGLLAGLLCMLALALPAAAAPSGADLARTLRLGDLADIMRQEGLSYAADLDADMLGGDGGEYWMVQARRIYDRDRMLATVTQALDAEMDASERGAASDFFDSELGREILTYETAARSAMADDEVEEIARQTYADLAAEGDPRLDAITRFVEVNDLMERNVAGALSSNYQFYRGLVDGGAMEMGEQDIIADVWAQEEEIREDTRAWLYGFLLMAYRPLEDEELERYIAFSETEAGRALNAAMFSGFDAMYRAISYALGRAAAQAMEGSDL